MPEIQQHPLDIKRACPVHATCNGLIGSEHDDDVVRDDDGVLRARRRHVWHFECGCSTHVYEAWQTNKQHPANRPILEPRIGYIGGGQIGYV